MIPYSYSNDPIKKRAKTKNAFSPLLCAYNKPPVNGVLYCGLEVERLS